MRLILARNAVGNIDFKTCLPDRQRYQALTAGGVCIYGKTTWETLPPAARRNRDSIIVRSRLTDTYEAPTWVHNGQFYSNTIGDAFAHFAKRDDAWVCGGKRVYDYAFSEALHLISHIYLSTFADRDGSLHVDLPLLAGWDCLCSQTFEDHTFEIFRKRK